ncbi:hypothetical protein ACKVMT_09520 [Halobacteriales archaeon Cl-PHB]
MSDEEAASFEDDRSAESAEDVDPVLIEAGDFAVEDEEIAELFDRRPELAIGLLVFLAALAYMGITWVMDGRVDMLETAIFAVVFGLVWAFFQRYFGE